MKTSEMTGLFFKVEYFPNKLAYVLNIEGGRINLLYFCNECNNGFKAIKTSLPVFRKSDLKTIANCFTPGEKRNSLITEFLNNNKQAIDKP